MVLPANEQPACFAALDSEISGRAYAAGEQSAAVRQNIGKYRTFGQ
jgi:hypothetical protein